MSTRDNNVPSPGEHPLQISQWFAARSATGPILTK